MTTRLAARLTRRPLLLALLCMFALAGFGCAPRVERMPDLPEDAPIIRDSDGPGM